ncbi:MAG: SusC/RagA family TonB-linked outer membrane protein [Cyclobacteriaceae bacterium]
MKKSFTEKLWIVMKIGAVQLILALTLCGMSMAHSNFAQLLDKEISIQLINVRFEDALKEIEKSAKIKFAYSIDQLNTQDEVSLNAQNQKLKDFLHDLLVPRQIKYNVHEKTGTITLKKIIQEEIPLPKHQTKIKNALAQITGTITDAGGQPMAGVNIVIKGTTNGTTSDANGNYTINVQEGEVLTFSFIGFASVELRVGSQSRMNVVLEEDVQSLGEVIVNAGYWTVPDREQTGNISKLTADEIEKQPVNNPLQAMQGRMAGVYIQQSSGVPGSEYKIQIRGKNSLRPQGNDPLYIVDGVPYNGTPLGSIFSNGIVSGGSPLNQINPADIHSIEILKDADATAIYGSRGANGVVLITTKKGIPGKTKFDVNVYSGAGKVTNQIGLLNASQYLEMRREAFRNDNIIPNLGSAPDLIVWDTLSSRDWQQELIGGTAQITSAQIALSGGDSQTQFAWGSGYLRESTVFPGDFNDQKISSHLNLTHKSSNNKLNLTMSAIYVFDKNRLLYEDLTAQALNLPAVAPKPFDESGNLNWEMGFQNPYSTSLQSFKSDTYNLITNAILGYEIFPNLQIKSNMGFNIVDMKENVHYPIAAYNPAFGIDQGAATFGSRGVNTWILEPQMQYKLKLGQGQLSALAGATFQQTIKNGQTTYGYGFSSDALLNNLQAASGSSIIFSENTHYRYSALFGRINYIYKDRYILNLTTRRDGSSRFGNDKKFANFGAMGAAWIFTEESFLQNLTWLSFGKIRGSFGVTGSDQIGDYQYLETYSSSNYPYQGTAGLYPNRLGNEDYSWEQNNKTEGGMELGFSEDRIRTSISYYSSIATNQLVGQPLSSVTGFSSVQFNLPAKVKNTGWELLLDVTLLERANWQWNVTGNVTIPKNKLLEFPDLDGSSYANTYEVGKSLFIQKRFHGIGVKPETGIYEFEDVNGNNNGSDFPEDLQSLKSISQKYYGGINNNFKYKTLELSVFLQIVNQTGLGYFSGFGLPGTIGNQPQWVTNRWQKPGDIAEVQKYTLGIDQAATAYYLISNSADNNIVDASFVRLKNISLSWDLPGKWISKAKMTKSRVYLQGQNVLTFTKYKGLDPETQSLTSLPPIRMITGGIQVTF